MKLLLQQLLSGEDWVASRKNNGSLEQVQSPKGGVEATQEPLNDTLALLESAILAGSQRALVGGKQGDGRLD